MDTFATPRLRFSLWVATLYHDGSVVAGCVFARAPLSRRFISLPFSDTCAPLAREPEAAHLLLNALITQAPSHRAYEIRGIGGMAPWETVDCFVNWQLNLDLPLGRIERGLAVNFRRNLRKASGQAIRIERGSSIEFLERFYSTPASEPPTPGAPTAAPAVFPISQGDIRRRGQFRGVDSTRESRRRGERRVFA